MIQFIVNTLFVAIFFISLGTGNSIVGQLKGEEYKKVLIELHSLTPKRHTVKSSSPLVRLVHNSGNSRRLGKRVKKATSRQKMYQFVVFGGQTLTLIGLSGFIIASILYFYKIKFH